ncbi:large tegument protein [Gracilaria domingensis]|nr:large tegument protein [Gracilaria domingensis]
MRAAAGVAVRAGSGEGRKRDEAGDDGGEERGAVHERQQWACGEALRWADAEDGVRVVGGSGGACGYLWGRQWPRLERNDGSDLHAMQGERGEAADGDAQERGQDARDPGEPRGAAGAGLDLLQRGDEDVCNGGGHWRRAEAQDRRGRRGRGRQRGDGAAEVVRARGGAGAVWGGSGGANGGAAAGVHGEEAACGSGRAAAGARGGAARGAGGAQGVRRRAARLGGGAGDRRDAHCARARARARGRARGRARERRVGAGGETARRRDGGAAELHAAAAAGVRRRRRRRTPTCGSLTRAAPCGRSRGARALGRARAARAATAAAGGRRRAGGGRAARGRARAQRARF